MFQFEDPKKNKTCPKTSQLFFTTKINTTISNVIDENTLPETNQNAPENGFSPKETNLPTIHLYLLLLLVSGRVHLY